MSEEKKSETMAKEFKDLLAKYNCETVIGFRINSADQINWELTFREIPPVKVDNAGS